MKYPKIIGIVLFMQTCHILWAQPSYDYNNPFTSTSQLGFRPKSVKSVSLFPGSEGKKLPDQIPFYIQHIGDRLTRKLDVPAAWGKSVFRWPFELDNGPIIDATKNYKSFNEVPQYAGKLIKKKTRWGVIWQAEFTDFQVPGFYQIETEYGFTVPFEISDLVYERLERSYLNFMNNQRSGVEIPGVRSAENADDGRLYSDESYYLPVAGGWNDAGDWRKWLFLTLGNVEALSQLATNSDPAFQVRAIDELIWGNAYFHHMINDEGRVYEDVGGGSNRSGDYETTWWNENHPGVTAAGDNISDGLPMNGDERHVRENHNPLVQFLFVRHQALASTIMSTPYKNNCLVLAERAWKYSQKTPHDRRTIFVAEELLAALELYNAGSKSITTDIIKRLVIEVMERQEISSSNITGYFMEKDKTDGYRSVAFPVEPAMGLLRLCELSPDGLTNEIALAKQSITAFVDQYLIADGASNPFGVPPYGVYTNPSFSAEQSFRKIDNGRYIRTFIHLFHKDQIPHGTGGTILQQGYFMARAGKLFDNNNWKAQAERTLQWSTGHNTFGLCLFYGVGFKHAVPGNFVNYNVPDGVSVGFLGRPDDTPYMEYSHAVEWSTQEVWDVPFYYTIGLINYLK